jgi:hypothetical protein
LITAPSTIGTIGTSNAGHSDSASNAPFNMNMNEKNDSNNETNRRTSQKPDARNEKRNTVKSSWFGWKLEKSGKDVEADQPAARPTRLFAPVYNGLGAGLCLCEFVSLISLISTFGDIESFLTVGFSRLYGQWYPNAVGRVLVGSQSDALRTLRCGSIPVLRLSGTYLLSLSALLITHYSLLITHYSTMI